MSKGYECKHAVRRKKKKKKQGHFGSHNHNPDPRDPIPKICQNYTEILAYWNIEIYWEHTQMIYE